MEERSRTRKDLDDMQRLPLDAKIEMTMQRIREWYKKWEGGVCVSFSGGKDSTVLKHIVDGMYDVPSVFVDTGLEFPEARRFVFEMKDGKHIGFNRNVEIIRPKMRFDEVVKRFGYPVATKDISHKIHAARNGSERALAFVNGTAVGSNGRQHRFCVPPRWRSLLDAPFDVSDYCCYVMKEQLFYKSDNWNRPYVGILAEESKLRQAAWVKNGCNAYHAKQTKSAPMAFWTEQDVFRYIVENRLPYCSIYGEIRQDDNGRYYTTNAEKTGCMFCMFGVHRDKRPNRFERMKETHPAQYDYCMNRLGLREVLDYIGIPY